MKESGLHSPASMIPHAEALRSRTIDDELLRRILLSAEGLFVSSGDGNNNVAGSTDVKASERGENVTRLDVLRMLKKLTDKELEEVIKVQLHLQEIPKSPDESLEAAAFYEEINSALATAKSFIRDELWIQLEESVQNTSIQSAQDFHALLRLTSTFSKSEKRGDKGTLNKHASACLLVRVALCEYMLDKEGADTLEGEMSYLRSALTAPVGTNAVPPLLTMQQNDPENPKFSNFYRRQANSSLIQENFGAEENKNSAGF